MSCPYAEITTEAVAARAGVSKQTIYRWWSGKHQLAMQAYAEIVRDRIPTPDTGTLGKDLHAIMRSTCAALRARGGATIAGLIAAAQSDAALATELRVTFIGARRKVMSELLERDIARGELARQVDVQVAMDLLYGLVWYRLLLRNAQLDDAFADAIVDSFLTAFRRRDHPAARSKRMPKKMKRGPGSCRRLKPAYRNPRSRWPEGPCCYLHIGLDAMASEAALQAVLRPSLPAGVEAACFQASFDALKPCSMAALLAAGILPRQASIFFR